VGVIGAISRACRLLVTTAVTAPTVRLHTAVVVQVAGIQLRGRSRLGVGAGEALNEHILADAWPAEAVRLEILEEAITVLRELWKADFTYTDEHPETSNTGRGPFSPEPARTANDRPATSKEGLDMATEKQKQAARRNLTKARAAQSARAEGKRVSRRSEGMSAAEQNDLAAGEFAFPEARKEPLTDAAHVRNAIARFDQVEGVSDSDRDKAWRRIKAAARRFDVEVQADDWRDLFVGGKAKKR
jgi:hypothetical protein